MDGHHRSPVKKRNKRTRRESLRSREAMAAFRRGAFAEMTFGQATQLGIRVKAPEEEHTITVGKVLSWLDGGGRSPSEQVKKNRLMERLRR
jgi:hypothetical protein